MWALTHCILQFSEGATVLQDLGGQQVGRNESLPADARKTKHYPQTGGYSLSTSITVTKLSGLSYFQLLPVVKTFLRRDMKYSSDLWEDALLWQGGVRWTE